MKLINVYVVRRATLLIMFVALFASACAAQKPPPRAAIATPRSSDPPTSPDPIASSDPTASPDPPAPPDPTALSDPMVVSTPALVSRPLAPIQPLHNATIVDRPIRNRRALTDGSIKYRLAQWSPGATWIAAVPQDGPGLDAIDSATGAVLRLVTDTYVLEPVWFDATRLLIHRVVDGADQLATLDVTQPDAPLREIARVPQPLRAVSANRSHVTFATAGALHRLAAGDRSIGAFDALWSAPIGDNGVAFNPVVADLTQVQTLLLRDNQLSELSTVGEGLWLPRPAPTSDRLALTNVAGRIVTTTIDGTARYDLGPGDAPAWSPDGARLAFAGANAGTEYTSRDIFVIDWQGNGPRLRLTRSGDEEYFVSPSWSPDGARLAFVELDSGTVFVGDAP